MQKRGLALAVPLAMLLALGAHAESPGASLYPSPDRPWTKKEYVEFYFAHFNGNRALPHLREPRMRAVFDRLVSPDNLTRLREASLSDCNKFAEIRLMLSALGEIRAAYNISVQVGEPLAEELTRVQVFTLVMLGDALRLSCTADAAPSLAWSTTIGGVFASLGESAVYSTVQRRQLAEALSGHMGALSPLLPGKAKAQAMEKVGTLAADEGDPLLRNALKRLLLSLSES